jgi:hypothetical protein
MRSRSKLSGRLAGVLIGLCALAAGCGGGGSGGSGNGATLSPAALGAAHPHPFLHAAPGAAVCNGADLSGVRTAIYVSPQGTLDPNCGTTTAATCKSVRQAIARCTGDGCAVLVRHGLYTEPDTIELKNGVSVYGGCRFGGEPDRKYRTTIQASLAAGTPVIAGTAIQSATTVHGLVVVGMDQSAGGSPSIAMALSGSRGLALTGSVLAAGRGGDGATGASANGQPGGPGLAPACPTCRGMPGAACPSNPPPVGVGGGGAGAASNVYYSHGCLGRCLCDAVNVADSLGLAGEGSNGASGGAGAKPGAVGCRCWGAESAGDPGLENPGTGNTGGPAQPGVCSTQGGTASNLIWGAQAQGAVWLPPTGGPGGPGTVGAGGGGGGAGGFSTWDGTDRDGMPGGGGGGGDGGPSIGIALRGGSPAPGNSSGIYAGTAGARGDPGGGGVNPNCSGVAGNLGAPGGAASIVNLDQGAAVGAR